MQGERFLKDKCVVCGGRLVRDGDEIACFFCGREHVVRRGCLVLRRDIMGRRRADAEGRHHRPYPAEG